MKKTALLSVILFLPVFLFSQKPFVPLGAKWGSVTQCSPTFWPCPPNYPIYHTSEVTEDTVIQGKYCTLIDEREWGSNHQNTFVHQDGYQIYRYDREDEEFKLVLDFSKDVGESWQIEAPHYWGGTDTLTIEVTEKDGDFRLVSVIGFPPVLSDLPLYEQFGGVAQNYRLLLGDLLFVIADPIIWDELTCYIDPEEGLLYGDSLSCEPTSTVSLPLEKMAFTVYPNPASTRIALDVSSPISKPVQWNLYNAMGQMVRNVSIAPHTDRPSMLIEDLPNGIYFWNLQSEGRIVGTGEVMVIRD